MEEEAPEAAAGAGGSATSGKLHYQWNTQTKLRAEELQALGVDHSPKPVSSPPAAVASPAAAVGSAWNAAGTWEERNVTAASKALLRKTMTGLSLPVPGMDGASLSVTEVSIEGGSVSLVFCRGKIKPGFELEVTLDYSIKPAGEEEEIARGALRFAEVADEQGSDVFDTMHVSVSFAASTRPGVTVEAVRKALASLKERFREAFRAWLEGTKAL